MTYRPGQCPHGRLDCPTLSGSWHLPHIQPQSELKVFRLPSKLMTDASPFPSQQGVQGSSPGRRKARKKGGAINRLNPLASTLTSNIGNGNGSGAVGVPGGNARPRKMFQKRDLVEAVRKMVSISASNSRVDLHGGAAAAGSGLKHGVTRMRRTRSSTDVGVRLRLMETGLVTTSRRYNELRSQADRKAIELQSLLDTLTMIKLEHDALERMRLQKTPESNRIGTLAQEIAGATEEIQGKLHYRRILHHMLERLERNKVIFHSHLNSMEETLNATYREKNEVESLTRQLETGRTKATLDLQEALRLVGIEKRERNHLMTNKEREAEEARKMEICRQQREMARMRVTQTLRGDLNSAQEAELMNLLAEKERATSELRAQNEIRQRQVTEMEATFVLIRQATGVATLEEILLKLANQSTNHDTLEEEKREAESKLSRAKAARQSKDACFSDMKASGVGSTELNRDITDKLNAEIQEYRVEAKMKKAAHERLQATLAGVKQGAVSLWQRLQPFTFLLDGAADVAQVQRMKERTDPEVERETVKVLALSETLLSMMLEVVSGAHETGAARFLAGGGAGGNGLGAGAVGGSNALGDGEDSSEGGSVGNVTDSMTCGSTEEVPSMRNNIRVQSYLQRAGLERTLESEGDPDNHPRWLKPSRGGAADGGNGGAVGGSGSGSDDDGDLGGLESDDEQAIEDMVPSRTFLKLCSSRQHTETIRKMESDERKKKLAERMETADETEKATLTSKLARKRQQDLAMERISAPMPIRGLPEGVSQRDDIYVKAQAFLTHVPNLE